MRSLYFCGRWFQTIKSMQLLIGHANSHVIQVEVAIERAGDHGETNAKTGVAEIGSCPGVPPGVGGAAQDIGGLDCAECGGSFRKRPVKAAVAGKFNTQFGRTDCAVRIGIETHLEALDDDASR